MAYGPILPSVDFDKINKIKKNNCKDERGLLSNNSQHTCANM